MYEFCTHHWSPIRGCLFECPYCYTQKFDKHWNKPRLDEEDLTTRLGKGKIVFVGSKCDMWGPWVPKEWITQVLQRCKDFPGNQYVFQSKNPGRFRDNLWDLHILLGTTIETDTYPEGFKTNAPSIIHRAAQMMLLKKRKFVTIEPIMDFSVYALTALIRGIEPEFVMIGADSKGHNLVEPPWEKVEQLISGLNKFVEIRQKKNLERLKKS